MTPPLQTFSKLYIGYAEKPMPQTEKIIFRLRHGLLNSNDILLKAIL